MRTGSRRGPPPPNFCLSLHRLRQHHIFDVNSVEIITSFEFEESKGDMYCTVLTRAHHSLGRYVVNLQRGLKFAPPNPWVRFLRCLPRRMEQLGPMVRIDGPPDRSSSLHFRLVLFSQKCSGKRGRKCSLSQNHSRSQNRVFFSHTPRYISCAWLSGGAVAELESTDV